MTEAALKIQIIRESLKKSQLDCIWLRGVDWFSWATAGASNVVLLSQETGIADVFITEDEAWILTTTIEEERLRKEEITSDFQILGFPWNQENPAFQIQKWVKNRIGKAQIASDRPLAAEVPLPEDLIRAKRRLLPEEVHRYQALGRDTAEAMTEVLAQAQSDWTEFQLAGASSNALWSRGIHPALILAGGAKRSIQYRHPFPSAEPLGRFAMLVFCARRHGLFANLTRFLFFEEPTFQERALFEALAKVESAVLSATQVGNTLGQCYDALVAGYQAIGFAGEQNHHHQGGMTGYLSREIVALPDMQIPIENSSAFAWNPSLPGIKREDTLLLTQKGIEFLTVDPQWPTSVVEGRLRPDFWVKK